LNDGPGVRYMDAGKAKAVSAEIFAEHAGLFRKLALDLCANRNF